MRITKKVPAEREIVIGITCDRCNESCLRQGEVSQADEYATLSAYWGHASNQEDTSYEYHFCEKCFMEIIAELNPEAGHKS